MKVKSWRLLFVLFEVLLLILTACSSGNPNRPTLGPIQNTPAESPFSTSTPMPTYTPTPAPIGSAENPLVMAVLNANPDAAQTAALNSLTVDLSAALHQTLIGKFYPDYFSLELALQNNAVHYAWLQPVEYLLASQKQLLTVQLVSNHLGVDAYGVQFLGNRDSNFTSYYDSTNNTSTANSDVALAQLAGLRGCFTSDNSLAGYWLPQGYLARSNIQTQKPIQTFSYSASIRALYIKGICDFAVTYAISADPRTSSAVINDLQDVIQRLPIIWISPAVIPNLSLSVSPQVDLPTQVTINAYLQDFARTESGKQLISSILNYETSALDPLPDSAYGQLRELLALQDIRLADLVAKP